MKKEKKEYITTTVVLSKEDYWYLQERILELKKQGKKKTTVSGYLRYLINKDKEGEVKNC
jgi:hypothetical protein